MSEFWRGLLTSGAFLPNSSVGLSEVEIEDSQLYLTCNRLTSVCFLKGLAFVASSFLDEKSFLHVAAHVNWRHLMSGSDEEPYSTIFASLKHPIRRRILRMLSKQPMTFARAMGDYSFS